jgi:hypothetical protein
VKQLLLAVALIAVPVAAFTGFNIYKAGSAPAAESAASLGDLAALQTIIADVQAIAATGDLKAAEVRITDFETAWDKDAATMRPLDTAAWGNVDTAADAALKALRAGTPVAADVTTTLSGLMAELQDPTLVPGGAAADTAAVTMVSGVAVTDANGRPLPCEEMIKQVATGVAGGKIADADKATVTDLQTKALERCNADDDQRADAFSAQALALFSK